MTDTRHRWSSRRFATMALSQVTFTLLLITGHIDGGTYTALTGLCLGAYFTSATIQKCLGKPEAVRD